MFEHIEDIIGIDNNGNKEVIGKVLYESETDYSKYKCFYIGWEFSREDVLFNEVNRNCFGIKDLNAFRQEYALKNAVGIIYFPQVGAFRYKKENDVVAHWEYGMTEEEIDVALNAEISKYHDKKEALASRINEIIDLVDDDDPLLELYDIPTLSRKTQSSRR